MESIFDRIKKDLKHLLSEKRYQHTLGVEKSAIMLSEKYGENIDKARISALLHDIAKQLSDDEIKEKIKKYNIVFDEIEQVSHQLLHAKIGRYIAQYEYNIEDEDILNAISYHTTGRADMSKLEMIICLADYIEENRKFEGVEKIRQLSYIDLYYALYYALNNTMIHLASENDLIHQDTLNARNFLLKNCKKHLEDAKHPHIKKIIQE